MSAPLPAPRPAAMRRTRTALIALVAASGMLVGTSVTATADDEFIPLPTEVGDGVQEGEDRLQGDGILSANDSEVSGNLTGADVLPETASKALTGTDLAGLESTLAEAYALGDVTVEEIDEAVEGTGASTEAIQQQALEYAPGEFTTLAATPTSRTLSVTHRAQALSYWCGPTTAQMILSKFPTSKYDGKTRSQSVLASKTYLATTKASGTPFKQLRMQTSLNKWLWGASTPAGGAHGYVHSTKPSLATYKSIYKESIGRNGKSVAVGTVERAGGVHYNKHPKNKTIGHWIVNYGYTSTGTKYADPANVLWGGSARFSTTTSTFIGRYVTKGNGAVYMIKV